MSEQLTFGSLFAGIGGMDLGLERAGMECLWQVEIDDYATRVLERHWPNVRRWRDVCTFPPDSNGASQPDGTVNAEKRDWYSCPSGWYADLICAGFPCQDISYAGKGAGLNGSRSGLFWETIRIIRELGPRYVLLENVSALLTRGLDDVLGSLASIGFDAEWHCIPAAAVGAPHIRDRVFIFAYQVADTDCQRLEGPELQRQRHVFQQRSGSSSWWATEPNVGRVAHGVSFELDCLGGRLGEASDIAQKDAEANWPVVWRFLRCVWEHRKLAATSPREYRSRLLDSVPEVSHRHAYEGWYVGARIEKDQGLYDLWEEFYAQSQHKAQDMLPKLLERIRKTKRPQALASRVDRLRGLGNAIVPQVAEFVGRQIVSLNQRRGT